MKLDTSSPRAIQFFIASGVTFLPWLVLTFIVTRWLCRRRCLPLVPPVAAAPAAARLPPTASPLSALTARQRRCAALLAPVEFLSNDKPAVQRLFVALWASEGCRIAWFLATGLNLVGGSSQCLSGTGCTVQVVITLTNRLSQLLFFLSCSRAMKHLGFAAHAKAWNYIPTPAAPPRLKARVESLTVLSWDLSHLALDWWLIIFQVVMLLVTLVVDMDFAHVYPLYQSYQFQVAAMYLLLGALYLIVVAQYRSLLWKRLRSAVRKLTCGIFSSAPPSRLTQESDEFYANAAFYLQHTPLASPSADVPPPPSAAARKPLVSALREHTSKTQAEAKERPYLVYVSLCCVIGGLLIIRAVMFLYTPVTGVQIKGDASVVMYPTFFYTAPEALVPFLLLYMLTPDGQLAASCCKRRVGAGADGGASAGVVYNVAHSANYQSIAPTAAAAAGASTRRHPPIVVNTFRDAAPS